MSIEKTFDKLDEKISSLLRSMGIIITLLFGAITVVLNYFSFNLIFSCFFLIIIQIFIANIIFTLYLYIVTSTEKDDFVEEFKKYNQLLKIFTDLHSELFPILSSLEKYYDDIFNNLNDDAKEVIKQTNNSLLSNITVNIGDTETNFVLRSVSSIYHPLEFFRKIFEEIGKTFILKKNLKSKKILNKIESLKVIINRYLAELNKYKDVIFNRRKLPQKLFSYKPIDLFFIFLENCRYLLNSNYSDLDYFKDEIKLAYSNKIKIAYSIYGISIIVSFLFIFFIVLYSLIGL